VKKIIITNNPLIVAKTVQCNYMKGSLKDVLIKGRDYIHSGYKLINHPLYGSLKPNETPYRTLILYSDNSKNNLDFKSLELIENAILSTEKFHFDSKFYSKEILNDFQVLDYSLVESALIDLEMTLHD
jgi:hypothetical protein